MELILASMIAAIGLIVALGMRWPDGRRQARAVQMTAVLWEKDLPALLEALPAYSIEVCAFCGSLHLSDGRFCCICGGELGGFAHFRATYEEAIAQEISEEQARALYRAAMREAGRDAL